MNEGLFDFEAVFFRADYCARPSARRVYSSESLSDPDRPRPKVIDIDAKVMSIPPAEFRQQILSILAAAGRNGTSATNIALQIGFSYCLTKNKAGERASRRVYNTLLALKRRRLVESNFSGHWWLSEV